MPLTSLAFNEKFTGAKFIGNFVNGSPEWHELRGEGIGGSEVGTICCLNKWESAFTLWAKKSGLINDLVEPNEAMEAGTLLEKFILDNYFVRLNPDLVVYGDVGTFALDWSHANPDAIYQNTDGSFGIWECKTARFEDDWNVPKRGERGVGADIPKSYYAQVQWYMRVMGFKEAIVSVLFGGQKYREFFVPADPFAQETDLVLATRFWDRLQSGEAPDWDGSKSTYESVRSMNTDVVDVTVDLPAELGDTYLRLQFDNNELESKLNKVKSEIMAFMGDAKNAKINGVVRLTRQNGRNGGSPFLVNKG